MAGSTIRDVVIRVALQQVQSALVKPDVEPVKKAAAEALDSIKRHSAETNQSMSAAAKIAGNEVLSGIKAQVDATRQQIDTARQALDVRKEQLAQEGARRAAMDEQDNRLKRITSGWMGLLDASLRFGQAAVLSSGNASAGLTNVLENLMKLQAGIAVLSGLKSAIEAVGLIAGISSASVAAFISTVGPMAALGAGAAWAIYKFSSGAADMEKMNREGTDAARAQADEDMRRKMQLMGVEAARHDRLSGRMSNAENLAWIDERQQTLRRDAAAGGDPSTSRRVEAERLQKIEDELLRNEERREAILRSQTAELRGQLQQTLAQVDAAHNLATQERARVESVEESVGKLSDVQRARAMQIAPKIKDGTATEAELREFEGMGLGGIAEGRRSGIRRERGAAAANMIAEAAGDRALRGEGSTLEYRERAARDRTKEADDLRDKIEKMEIDVDAVGDAIVALVEKAMEKLAQKIKDDDAAAKRERAVNHGGFWLIPGVI